MRDYENVSVVNDGETRVWVSIVLRSVPDGALSRIVTDVTFYERICDVTYETT